MPPRLANDSRNLFLPWVKAQNLAFHALAFHFRLRSPKAPKAATYRAREGHGRPQFGPSITHMAPHEEPPSRQSPSLPRHVLAMLEMG
jgi:hypothetical protein